jgi:hypothetical protein
MIVNYYINVVEPSLLLYPPYDKSCWSIHLYSPESLLNHDAESFKAQSCPCNMNIHYFYFLTSQLTPAILNNPWTKLEKDVLKKQSPRV